VDEFYASAFAAWGGARAPGRRADARGVTHALARMSTVASSSGRGRGRGEGFTRLCGRDAGGSRVDRHGFAAATTTTTTTTRAVSAGTERDGVDDTDADDDDDDDPSTTLAEERVGIKGNWGESSGRTSATPKRRESIDGQVFRPRERLKTNADFDRVKKEGRSFNGNHVRIRAAGNASYEPATCTRIGIVVPKKQVKRAVDRNLIKRRVRHIFRTNKDRWPNRVDFIVFVNSTALEGGFDGLRDDMFAWADSYSKRLAQSADRAAYKARKAKRAQDFETPSSSGSSSSS
jgi:ribonuclease P protein component